MFPFPLSAPAPAPGVAADLQTFGSLYPSESELVTSSTWCAIH